jgi:hypothetical protein
MKTHEFERIVKKLGFETRNSRDRLAWFVYNGQTILRTKRSQGNKEQPGDKIRQQLKVNEEQLAGLISCTVTLENYIEILKAKRLIVVTQAPESEHPPAEPKPQAQPKKR